MGAAARFLRHLLGGSSESTGKAFDLKLSDKNSTSFYIVNTGTENVFTRAGAFYVDGGEGSTG